MKSIEETVQIFIDAPIMTENTVDDQEMPEIGLDQFPENQST